MSVNDYSCTSCGTVARDVLRMPGQPIERPVCCGTPMEWIPGRVSVDKLPFAPFDLELDGRTEHVDSLHTMRRIERESEQRERNGEGQVVAWRDLSQDQSNRDANIFGEHTVPKFSTRNSRGVPYVTSVNKQEQVDG